MKKSHKKLLTVACLTAIVAFNLLHASAALLKTGSSSSEVKNLQLALKQLGYFKYPKATGYYGSITTSAVRKFQKESGLAADGIVGSKTKAALAECIPNVKSAFFTEKQSGNNMLDWFKEVQYIWKRGMNATVTDVDTGKSFKVKRTFGTNHADVEPLTKKDTQTIKDIWNGWSWERRAVVIKAGGTVIAGSMTAMPHAGVDSAPAVKTVNNRSCGYGRGENLDAVKGNGANGVMDIHFLNSRTHSSNQKQSSQQNMVKKAGKYIAEKVV